jgi:hypothetical protein
MWGDYAALSYAWGDERVTCPILLNGHQVEVTANLAKALRSFCTNDEFGGDFKLWVDALCINQQDLAERSSQVQMMRDIYGNAWSVICWLGEESRQSHWAIQLVQDLAVLSQSDCAEQLESQLRQEPDYLGKGCWLALSELMERPYWFRLWVIQEIVMGGTATRLRCGNSSIGWGEFSAGISFLEEHLWLVKDDILVEELKWFNIQRSKAWTTTSLHLVYYDLSAMSRREEHGGRNLTFGRLLDISNSAGCKDPRDKVWALAGLMDPSIAKNLQLDYTLDPAVIMASTTRQFIQAYDNLEPLREGNPWGLSNSPSWAADWQWKGRVRWSRTENPLWGPSWINQSSRQSSYLPYSASGDTRHDTSFSHNGSILTCSGVIVDSVSGLCARGTSYFSWSKESIVCDRNWKSVYGSSQATAEALYRTLVLDRGKDGQRADHRHSAILNLPSTFKLAETQFASRGWSWLAAQSGYYFRWEAFRTLNTDFMLGENRLGDFFTDNIPLEASERDYTEVYCCFDRASQKRRLITTTNRYMGWASDNIFGGENEQVRRGDFIAVVFGCSTPIIIRPQGTQALVLGEAYVHGLMAGEALTGMNDSKLHVQRFSFC